MPFWISHYVFLIAVSCVSIMPKTDVEEELKLVVEIKSEFNLTGEDGTAKLEVDNNIEDFTVYPSVDNPYGSKDAESSFGSFGLTVEYESNKWTISLAKDGAAYTAIESAGFFRVHLVLHDAQGNAYGTMFGTTEKNTFTQTVL